MNADNIAKLLSGLISLNGSLVQSGTTIKNRSRWSKQAKLQVGDLGWTYKLVITTPNLINRVLLGLILLASLIALAAGALLLKGLRPPYWMKSVFDNSILISVIYASIFLIPLHFNFVSHFLLWILTKIPKNFRFNPGWINADWQLNYYKEFFAMNTNNEQCERLANAIFRTIKTQSKIQLPQQAPEPEGLTKDEVANYLLFGCAIERRIHQLYPGDRTKLTESWQYLCWASMIPERPFNPENLKSLKSSDREFYQFLRELGSQDRSTYTQSEGVLPNSQLISNTVENLLACLVKESQGRAKSLATGHLFHRRGSPSLLLRRLKRIKGFHLHEDESIRRLFLKLGVRMGVWPFIDLGPFLYPYNSGIAILLLNSNCLSTSADTDSIEVDDNFRALANYGEHCVVECCYQMIKHSSSDAETQDFCKVVFKCAPDKIDKWRLSDYIDLWLFGHARHYCTKRDKDSTGSSLGCPLASVTGVPCFCDAAKSLWHIEGRSLKRS